MSIEFDCLHCNTRLAVDSSATERQVTCTSCGGELTVPADTHPLLEPQKTAGTIFCTKCGQQNQDNNYKCTRCGFILHPVSQPGYVVASDNTLGGLIPYRNASALWAYYLGVFSLIPFLGIPIGIVAVVLGFRGLRYVERHPEAKGKAHAWAGIIVGGGFALGYIVLIAVLLMLN
jgi:DNA-directed RNA polymerase subunit RPC12/RpoP